MNRFRLIINQILESHVTSAQWLASFLGIIALRVFIERIFSSAASPFQQVMIEYLHDIFFFGMLFVLIWLIMSFFMNLNPAKLAFLISGGLWLVVLPPLLDMAKTGGKVFWSFYLLDGPEGLARNFITLFGHLPGGIMYFGTKIIFILTVLLCFLIVLIHCRSWIKALLGAFFVYAAIFFMGSFPSFLAYGYYFFERSRRINEVKGFHIMALLGKPWDLFGVRLSDLGYAFTYQLNLVYYPLLLLLLGILFASFDRKKFWSAVKNARPVQIIYHGGLFCIGLGLGWAAYPENFHLNLFSVLAALDLLLAVWMAWEASVIINDIHDIPIDLISNPKRPLPIKIFETSQYLALGIIFFTLSILGGIIVGLQFAAALLLYQFLAWTYSARPYRLKRIPVLATFISALASLIVIFTGFLLFSGEAYLSGFSWRIIWLLLISLTLSLPLKDLKDIEGDKKDRVWTLPVIFGEKKARIMIGCGIFVSFILSSFLLNERKLFPWALIFGVASFLLVVFSKYNEKKSPPESLSRYAGLRAGLFLEVMGIVAVYGIILVKIVFSKYF